MLMVTDPGILAPILDVATPDSLDDPISVAKHCTDLVGAGCVSDAMSMLPRLSEHLAQLAASEAEPDAASVMTVTTAAYLTLLAAGNAEGAHDAALHATSLLGEHPASLHLLAQALLLTSDSPSACRLLSALAAEHPVDLDESRRAIAISSAQTGPVDLSSGFGASFGSVVRLSQSRVHLHRGDTVAAARAAASALNLADDAPVYGSLSHDRDRLGRHWTVKGGLTANIPTDALWPWTRTHHDASAARSPAFTDAFLALPPLLRAVFGSLVMLCLSSSPRTELAAVALVQQLLADGPFGPDAVPLGPGCVPSLADADIRAPELWAPPSEQLEIDIDDIPPGFEPVLGRDLRWSAAVLAPVRDITREDAVACLMEPRSSVVKAEDASLGPPRTGLFLAPTAYQLAVEPTVETATLYWSLRLHHSALLASVAQGAAAAPALRLKALKPPPSGDDVESVAHPSSYIPLSIFSADEWTPTPDEAERYAASLCSVVPPGQRGTFMVPYLLASGRTNALDAAEVRFIAILCVTSMCPCVDRARGCAHPECVMLGL